MSAGACSAISGVILLLIVGYYAFGAVVFPVFILAGIVFIFIISSAVALADHFDKEIDRR